jgi:hypothetical protein
MDCDLRVSGFLRNSQMILVRFAGRPSRILALRCFLWDTEEHKDGLNRRPQRSRRIDAGNGSPRQSRTISLGMLASAKNLTRTVYASEQCYVLACIWTFNQVTVLAQILSELCGLLFKRLCALLFRGLWWQASDARPVQAHTK